MSIPTTCPSCRAEFDVPDRLAGKLIRCKTCREEFRAGRAVARDDYDDEPAPRASGGSSSVVLVLVIVGVLGVGVLSVGGLAVWFLMASKGAPPAAVVTRGRPIPQPAPNSLVLPDHMLPGPKAPAFGHPEQPADGPILVTLSNPRKMTGPAADRPMYQIDFQWQGQIGNNDHPHLYVKTAGGIADTILRHDRRKGSGTLSLAFFPGQDPGPGFEVWIARQKLNKHNWEYTRLSNVVTVN